MGEAVIKLDGGRPCLAECGRVWAGHPRWVIVRTENRAVFGLCCPACWPAWSRTPVHPLGTNLSADGLTSSGLPAVG
jgi:hypothetical protein